MSPQQNYYCEHCLKDFGRGHHCCDCDTEDEAPTPALTLDAEPETNPWIDTDHGIKQGGSS